MNNFNISNITKADLILDNALFYSHHSQNSDSHFQPQAMAIAQGRIIGIGNLHDFSTLRGPETRLIDLRGSRVLPGFTESHGHLIGLGRIRQMIPLFSLTSEDQVVKAVAEKMKQIHRPEHWILGRGWDQNLWHPSTFPTHHGLSQVSPRNPVYLTRIDGHASWVNQRALTLAGITEKTPDPSGGLIVRDDQGRPTGVLIDKAMDLVEQLQPARDHHKEREALSIGIQECLKYGITSFHDACSPRLSLSLYKELWEADQLGIRIYAMIDGQDPHLLEEILHHGPLTLGDHELSVRAVKLFSDGALGSCGAALHEDYCHRPHNKGLLLLSEEEIFEATLKALQSGIQVCTHAIGDKANTMVLNAYERALLSQQSARPSHGAHLTSNPRLRVEHAELIRPEDIPRFARSGIIASMQATHCTSDMPWIEDRLGESRAKTHASLWRSLLDSGAVIANGSDAPIESVNPIWGLYSSITRQDHQGQPPHGWNPEQRMTRHEALRSFSLAGAYASFAEDTLGDFSPGKMADLIVISRDLLTIPEKDILETEVMMTMVGGKTLYQHPRWSD